MAEQIVSDLIMKFVGDDGQEIEGEVNTKLNLRRSAMLMGFAEGKMFEVESFTFKAGIGGEDLDELAEQTKAHEERKTKKVNKALKQVADQTGAKIDNIPNYGGSGFKKFRSNEGETSYPVDIKPIEFTRSIDKSSAILMQYCIKRRVFKSATLIKRKAAGGAAAGEVFLRFDFNTVLIKTIEWDNDDPIKETCEFVCRAVTIHYLPQLPDGSLGAPKQAFWSASPTLKPEILRA